MSRLTIFHSVTVPSRPIHVVRKATFKNWDRLPNRGVRMYHLVHALIGAVQEENLLRCLD
ncbi:hypothetical protein [Vibrio phage vB_VhaP_PG11]|nr:hypothetical protein [Vibrio phage vB_VhaP_PG11]